MLDLTLTEALQDVIAQKHGPGTYKYMFDYIDPQAVLFDPAPHPALARIWAYVKDLSDTEITTGWRPTTEDVRLMQECRPDLFVPGQFMLSPMYRVRRAVDEMWRHIVELNDSVYGCDRTKLEG